MSDQPAAVVTTAGLGMGLERKASMWPSLIALGFSWPTRACSDIGSKVE